MRKILSILLVVAVVFAMVLPVTADERRTTPHKFRSYTANTSVAQGKTIYRITGVATGSNAVFGIHNVATLGEVTTSSAAVEGGEATSGDALPHYDFGEDGLTLDTGSTVVAYLCTIVVEYL